MDTSLSRRHVLAGVANLAAFGAGCLGSPDPTDGAAATPQPSTSSADPSTTDETHEFPPDVDERVDAEPPGSPALDPSGAWPMPRFDAGNTAYNPGGTGLRDAEPYWRLDAGGPATVRDGRLYNVHGRDRESRVLTVRDPTTAATETAPPLVEYGVNSPPVVGNDRVFVSTFIEVFCFDAQTGERLWRGPEMDGVMAPPAVHDGAVYVNSSGYKSVAAQLRAFDAATGDELWRYDPGALTKGTPAVADGRVFLVSETGLHAVDAETGDESYVVAEHASPWVTPVVRDGTAYLVGADDATELVALDAADGTIGWRSPVDQRDPPVVADDRVYTRTSDGLVALDAADGSVATTFGRDATPAARTGEVLYGTHDGGVYAFDASTSESLWSFRTEEVQISDTIGRRVYHVTPVDGAVYVSARDAFYGVGPS